MRVKQIYSYTCYRFSSNNFYVVQGKVNEKTIECIGPEIFSFKEITLKLLKAIDKKRLLIPLPLLLAKIECKNF